MKDIKNGIFKENPIFVLLLGLCPALAVTTKFENAYIMGICVLIILIFSNVIISIIKKFIPENVKIPVYVLIIGTFVTIVELLLKNYVPEMYKLLGIYLPLIVVNCIVLGRALSVASTSSIKKSFMDAIGTGLGFISALIIVSLIREILGTNTLTIMDGVSSITGYKAVYKIFPANDLIPFKILVDPAGAFLILGILIAIFNKYKGEKYESN